MKKHLFIIGLWAACVALPNVLQAQWTFNVISVTQTGSQFRCEVGYAMTKSLATQTSAKSYPTREQCESNRQWVVNFDPDCVSVVCGPCTGPPGGSDGGFSNEIGSTNITGTNQGDPFHTDNPYDALTDAYDQKTFQNERLLGEQEQATTTGDTNFDAQFAKFTGGRPSSAEGIFNWEKQGRPSLNNDVRNNRAGGRAGATGGSNIRPTGASAANRYNGQMFFGNPVESNSFFGRGGGIRKNTHGKFEALVEKLGNLPEININPSDYEGLSGVLKWNMDREKIITTINQQDNVLP
jgi:hypothetical protein